MSETFILLTVAICANIYTIGSSESWVGQSIGWVLLVPCCLLWCAIVWIRFTEVRHGG